MTQKESVVSATDVDYPDALDTEPKFPLGERPLHEYLEYYAKETPAKTAINYYGREISYAEWNEASAKLASHLVNRGCKKGDVLLLYLQNTPQIYIGYYAAYKLGMKVSPCNPMTKRRALEHQINDTSADIIFTHDTVSDILSDVRKSTSLEHVIYTRYETYLPEKPVPELHEDMIDAIQRKRKPDSESEVYFEDVLSTADSTPPDTQISMDDISSILYTSGTTGLPKGCMHTHRSTLFAVASYATMWEFEKSDRHISLNPVFHIAGKTHGLDAPLIHGSSIILLSRYELESLLTAIDVYRPTVWKSSFSIITDILGYSGLDEYDLTSLQRVPTVAFTETVTADNIYQWMEITGSEMAVNSYGLTETHNGVTLLNKINRLEEQARGLIGLPSYSVTISIRDPETHEVLPRGREGEICINGPSLMTEYHNNPAATSDVFHNDYLLSGDLGYLCNEGFLYYLGRIKNMIKSSGYSVSPFEAAQILETHDRITNATVVGRPHEKRGEEIVAFVTVSDDTVLANELLEWSVDNMAAYKRPREIVILDSLPQTNLENSAKVDRQKLEEQAKERR